MKQHSAVEKNSVENETLREALKQRTNELEKVRRALEVEAALESVRAVAMGMKEPNDMLDICREISTQLQILGIEGLRNVQTAIFISQKESYKNYEYFGGPDVTIITEVDYREQADVHAFALTMLSDPDAFFTTTLQGKQLSDFIAYQEQAGQFVDPLQYAADALHYYFYSIGSGALGISTYKHCYEEQLSIIKRFRNVFLLAYRRYTDIKQAEAQAREAEIQLALERVRARSLSMHHSEELQDVVNVVAQQLYGIGIDINGGVFIVINDEVGEDLPLWAAAGMTDYVQKVVAPFLDRPFFYDLLTALKKRNYLYIEQCSNEEKLQLFEHLFQYEPWKSTPPERKSELLSRGGGLSRSIAISHFTSIAITDHYGKKFSEEENEILIRFGKVFEQSYIRFLDLQKAEAQAREAQIELSMERVRAKAMAMQNSDELSNVLSVLFDQFEILGISPLYTHLTLLDVETNSFRFRMTGKRGKRLIAEQVIDIDAMPQWKAVVEEWKTSPPNTVSCIDYPKEDVPRLFEVFGEIFSQLPKGSKIYPEDFPDGLYTVQGNCKFGYIGYEHNRPATEEEKNIVIRFATEFGRLYQRFLDLQKAEAQAREAQIEAALERVRSKAMAMHNSADLPGTAIIAFTELKKLGFIPIRCGISIHNKENRKNLLYSATSSGEGDNLSLVGWAMLDNHPVLAEIYNKWLVGEDYFPDLRGDLLKTYYEQVRNSFSVPLEHTQQEQYGYFMYFTQGVFYGWCEKPVTDHEKKLLRRFAAVIDLTFKRYFDLQKAEAQAREAQIEAALERVRSRSMAMHKSDELKEVIRLVLEQFIHLDIKAEHAGFYIDYKAHDDMHIWLADPNIEPFYAVLPYFDTPTWNSFLEAKNKGITLHTDLLDFETKNKFYRSLFTFFEVPDEAKQFYLQCKGLAVSTVLLDSVGLYIENFDGTPYTDEENNILIRFGNVFQQTYTRFLDLKKAEAQTREALIEAALERTRTQSMLMQHSNELNEISRVFHEQLLMLGIDSEFSFVWLPNEEQGNHLFWATWVEGEDGTPTFKNRAITYPLDKNEPYTAACYTAWESDKAVHVVFVPPEEIATFFAAWEELLRGAGKLKPEFFPEGIYYAEAYMKYGCFGIDIRRPISEEEQNILYRFSIEFERTYTRFLDLKRAEAQAREAQIELSLERIRAQVSAMQESSDLLDIVVMMRNEFVAIGHEAHYFWYMRWLPDKYEKAMTSGDGTRIGMVMSLPRHIHGDIKLVADWEKGSEPTLVFAMDVDTAVEYVHKMITLGDFELVDPQAPTLDDIRHIGGLTFVMARTTHGEIGYSLPGTIPNPSTEALALLGRFASVFDLAYKRFLDLQMKEVQSAKLKEEKDRLEQTLNELQVTQKQLIQSEKMASLGELTAGIAHEIQNPLNFVNNFSEVSKELIDEFKSERSKVKGERDELLEDELLNDIAQNLEKINHHGKRADAIVKGMLQHSRSSSGVKEPTDINALCDEYLRLAYHGFKANDNSFEASFRFEPDSTLPRVNVVPQDIGRVLLNLISNAFQAVGEKVKRETADVKESTDTLSRFTSHFSPLVTLSTKMLGDSIEISVQDNGPGIPDSIKDKIFQPFFTTKPTGQGTGLGLSLSYDIVKAHGGAIKVTTKENEGSEFTIQLPI